MLRNNKAQEEIVGFAMIVIIVSIILVFFLIFSLSDKSQAESYEASSWLQASLQYTSDCMAGYENLPVQKLIAACYNQEKCESEEEACEVLNDTLIGMLEESWQVGDEFPIRGYKLEITSGEENILSIEKGNVTSNYRGTQQVLPERGISIQVLFRTYY